MRSFLGYPQGPKTKHFYQQVIAACSDQDPAAAFRRARDLEPRPCGIWIDRFDLSFKKVRKGQWLYRQETPHPFSKVLKIYELTGDGVQWTLSETHVPTEGSDEKLTRTVWSWDNFSEYELPCEFISNSVVLE